MTTSKAEIVFPERLLFGKEKWIVSPTLALLANMVRSDIKPKWPNTCACIEGIKECHRQLARGHADGTQSIRQREKRLHTLELAHRQRQSGGRGTLTELPFLFLPKDRRLGQSEQYNFFAGDGADVMMETQHLDAGDLLDECFHDRPCRFDELVSYLFEQLSRRRPGAT